MSAEKRKRTPSKRNSNTPPPKRSKKATWTAEQTKLLTEQINAGESVANVAKLFPDYTVTQIHSKVSNLKKQGAIKTIASSGIAPSLKEGILRLQQLIS